MKNKKKNMVTRYLERHFERVENPTPQMIRRRQGGLLMFMNMLIWFVVGDCIGTLSVVEPIRYVYINPVMYASAQESPVVQETSAPVSEDTDDAWVMTAVNSGGEESETQQKHADSTLHDLITKVFPEDSTIALAIARSESGLNPRQESTTDKMADGRPFSIGLMQINLTVSSVGGVDCTKAFSGRNYHAVVVDEDLYERCVDLAKDPEHNLVAARHKYDGRKQTWLAWGAYTNGAYKRFIQ